MKPTAFSYAEYSKLQIDMERKNEYVNALIAENERLRKQLDAAVEDMKQTHCIGATCYICEHHGKCPRERVEIGYCGIFKWRGAERGE